MVNLFINGKNIKQEDSVLFGDFIETLHKELASREQIVASIKINGKILDENQEGNLQMHSLGTLGKIEISTDDPVQMAFSALGMARDYINKIIAHSKKTSALYEAKDGRAEKHFLELVDSLDNLTHLILSVQGVLRTKYKTIHGNDPSLRIAQVRLVSAVEELVPAKKNNDLALLLDVLSKELPEALAELRDFGIPVMARLKRS